MENKSGAYIVSALLLSLSLMAGTTLISRTMYNIKAINNTLSVTGSAEKTIKSDTVKWTSSFSRQTGTEDLKAGSSQLKSDLAAVLKFFASKQVKTEQIDVQPPTMTVVCDNPNAMTYDIKGVVGCGAGRVVGYNFQQQVIIQSDEVDKVTTLAREAQGALVEQGILFNSRGLEYYYSKFSDLKLDMLGEATKNAQERAKRIAESTGNRVDKLQSVNMGVFQVTAANSTDVADYGFYDSSVIEKKVTAVVRAAFTLK